MYHNPDYASYFSHFSAKCLVQSKYLMLFTESKPEHNKTYLLKIFIQSLQSIGLHYDLRVLWCLWSKSPSSLTLLLQEGELKSLLLEHELDLHITHRQWRKWFYPLRVSHKKLCVSLLLLDDYLWRKQVNITEGHSMRSLTALSRN